MSEEKLSLLINAGIEEFAEKGLKSASLSSIAKKAGISVGVIYKYYADKDALFLECVRYNLKTLSELLKTVLLNEDDIEECIRQIVKTLIQHSKTQPSVVKMYDLITSREAEKFSKELANEIEGVSSAVYRELFIKAQIQGQIRKDADPLLFAFFFDSLLMMVQFSFCCDYYLERFKLYCGEDIFSDDEKIENEMVRFLTGALK